MIRRIVAGVFKLARPTLGFMLCAQAASAQVAGEAASVRGSVFDSLAHAPLAGAHVRFARESDPSQTRAALTDASGRFDLALAPGRWLVGIEHAHLDSLGVTAPVRRIDVAPGAATRLQLATPSARTLSRALCGAGAGDSDVVIVGLIHATTADVGVDSVDVFVQWTNLVFAQGQGRREVPTQVARTDGNGWFVLCGAPQRAEIVAWAERGRAATGLVQERTSDGPSRIDLWLDTASTLRSASAQGVEALRGLLEGERRRPDVRSGPLRYRAQVVDAVGVPVPGVRARISGHRFGFGNKDGEFVLDSLPAGSQTLEIRALGFVPIARALHLDATHNARDTIRLVSTKTLLDTIRVSAGRVYAVDATGFEGRRKTGIGAYIGKAEIDRLHPFQLTSLLQMRRGINIMDDHGDQLIQMSGIMTACTPTIWVDGIVEVFPAGPPGGAVMAPPPKSAPKSDIFSIPDDPLETLGKTPPAGLAELNSLVLPSEIVGVEIYSRPVEVPPQFSVGGYGGCGAIVIWTRVHSALPQVSAAEIAPAHP